MQKLKCLTTLLFVFTVINLTFCPLKEDIFADSPTFARQEIGDDIEDWINITTVRPTSKGSPLADILSVDYISNGRIFNATFWMSTLLYPKSLSNTNISYVILIDSDANTATGIEGGDYKIEVKWDNKTRVWTKQFIELESFDPKTAASENSRIISKDTIGDENFTRSYNNIRRYVASSADLDAIGFPNFYRVLFYTSEEKKDVPLVLDFTNWVQIPSTKYAILTSPDPIILTRGESTVVTVQLRPTSGVLSEGFGFNFTKIKEPSTNIEVDLNSGKQRKYAYTSEPEYLTIRVNDDAKPGKYIIPMLADISTNLTYFAPIQKSTPVSTHGIERYEGSINLSVQDPLPPIEGFRKWLSEWVDPLGATYITISTIVNGILGWKIWKKKKTEDNQEHNIK